MNLYIDTQDKILVRGINNAGSFRLPSLMQGDHHALNVYFVRKSGVATPPYEYESTGSATLKAGIVSPASRPSAGTFTLTLSPETTDAIPYNASPAQVKSALEALSNIGTGNIEVSGNSGGPWKLIFQGALANTDVDLVVGNGLLLRPESFSVNTVVLQHGGGGNDEIQFVRLVRDPLALVSEFTPLGGPTYGFTGVLAIDTPAIEQLVEGRNSATALFEIELMRAEGPFTPIQLPIVIVNDGIEQPTGEPPVMDPPLTVGQGDARYMQQGFAGRAVVTAGNYSVTVPHLGLTADSGEVLVTRRKSDDGDGHVPFWVNVQDDQFTIEVNAPPDEGKEYKFSYLIAKL